MKRSWMTKARGCWRGTCEAAATVVLTGVLGVGLFAVGIMVLAVGLVAWTFGEAQAKEND